MADEEPKVDLEKFKPQAGAQLLAGIGWKLTSSLEAHTIAQLGHGVDPMGVPVSGLRLMSPHPVIYIGEATLGGIIRRRDLFTVIHPDPEVVAQTEAWLWPLLPVLTAAAVRGFSYGAVAVVLDWERGTLRYMAKDEDTDEEPEYREAEGFTHYSRAVEVHPDACQVVFDKDGAISGVSVGGKTYNRDRVALFIWNPEFGEVVGQGARRRAWRDYCESLIVRLLRNKYLERSVDSPTVAWAPAGKVNVGGVDWEIPDYVNYLLQTLRGAGTVVFPSARENNGQGERKYGVEKLDSPDRRAIWQEALDRADSNMMLAFLVPPSTAGVEEQAGGGAARASVGMLKDHVQNLAEWVAQELERLANTVHRANYAASESPPISIGVQDVGLAAAQRMALSVLQLINANPAGEVARLSDVAMLLDKLGVPLRDDPLDAEDVLEEGARATGRPLDRTSEREQRREDATTDEGAEDTGGADEEREAREASANARAAQIALAQIRAAEINLEAVRVQSAALDRAHMASSAAISDAGSVLARAVVESSEAQVAAVEGAAERLAKRVADGAAVIKALSDRQPAMHEESLGVAREAASAALSGSEAVARVCSESSAATVAALESVASALRSAPPIVVQPAPVVIQPTPAPAPSHPPQRSVEFVRDIATGKITGARVKE